VEEWDWTLDFVTRGGPALAAYPEYRRVVEADGRFTVPDRAVGRRHRMAIGTITSDAAVAVQYLSGGKLGTVEESFIARLRPGDRFVFAGRLVYEGLAALLAWRISRLRPITFTLAVDDYGIELLSPDPAPLEEALAAGLLSPTGLLEDIPASLNAAEMAKRQFRDIARVAGLLFQGFPGQRKPARHLQASSGLFYEVFAKYDPGNLLLQQAHREVLEQQLERSRLGRTLSRLSASRIHEAQLARTSPLGFPLMVTRMRDQLSSEKLADRIQRMQARLEKAAG
jgi:ATP-dependent Lhr-like helicase